MAEDVKSAIELENRPLNSSLSSDNVSITRRGFPRRRWVGLAQLTLLNMVVSFDVSGCPFPLSHSIIPSILYELRGMLTCRFKIVAHICFGCFSRGSLLLHQRLCDQLDVNRLFICILCHITRDNLYSP